MSDQERADWSAKLGLDTRHCRERLPDGTTGWQLSPSYREAASLLRRR
jgi:hypothetical protein